jgi:hypothetical protein
MTARSIRRAAERKAKKLASKAEKHRVERPFQAAMPAFEPVSQASEHLCFEPELDSLGMLLHRVALSLPMNSRTMTLPSSPA